MGSIASGCAAVIISLSTSGGIGGFGLSATEKTIETDTLSPGMREKVCERFNPKALKKLAEARQEQYGVADYIIYHVTVTDDDGVKHRFDLSEATLPAEMLDLIDEM